MAPSGGPTEDYDEPAPSTGRAAAPALVMAFPRPDAFHVPREGLALGRDWFSERSLDDPTMSGSHARAWLERGRIHVRDERSHNGTFVGASRLTAGEDTILDDGAVLRLGKVLLIARLAFSGPTAASAPLGTLVGPYGLRTVAARLDAIARRPPTAMLILGETGTGKEGLARALAERLRPSRPNVTVNVATIPSALFESNIFGHVKGAFTGATAASGGAVGAAEGGCVFLDEIGELPLDSQPKLLRALEYQEAAQVGGSSRPIDVLFIGATNRPLEDMVADGRFRQDLLARFAARVEIPPLRDRPEDIFAIAQAVLAVRGEYLDPSVVEITGLEQLLLREWPDNVRELDRALRLIAEHAAPPKLTARAVRAVLGEAARTALTDRAIDDALEAEGGNQTRAATRLGVPRAVLLRRLGKRDRRE